MSWFNRDKVRELENELRSLESEFSIAERELDKAIDEWRYNEGSERDVDRLDNYAYNIKCKIEDVKCELSSL